MKQVLLIAAVLIAGCHERASTTYARRLAFLKTHDGTSEQLCDTGMKLVDAYATEADSRYTQAQKDIALDCSIVKEAELNRELDAELGRDAMSDQLDAERKAANEF